MGNSLFCRSVSQRDTSIDIIRGLAIFTMAAANAAPYGLQEPHPFLFRLYGSFAAPFFITLTGMMVYHSAIRKQSTLKHFIVRMLLILLVAAFIDIAAWKIFPFTTVDVLYLIAVATPVIYLTRELKIGWKILLILIFFFATPVLQQYFGYASYPTEFSLDGKPTTVVDNQTNILHHWLLDGWFPLFPWMGFALLGSMLGEMRWKVGHESFASYSYLFFAMLFMTTGIVIWLLAPTDLITRNGYSELFYPPTLEYIGFASGLLLLVLFVVDINPQVFIYKPFALLGECSLLMYIWHSFLIAYVIQPYIGICPMKEYMLTYAGLLAAMFAMALLVKFIKKRVGKMPYLVRFVIGG